MKKGNLATLLLAALLTILPIQGCKPEQTKQQKARQAYIQAYESELNKINLRKLSYEQREVYNDFIQIGLPKLNIPEKDKERIAGINLEKATDEEINYLEKYTFDGTPTGIEIVGANQKEMRIKDVIYAERLRRIFPFPSEK